MQKSSKKSLFPRILCHKAPSGLHSQGMVLQYFVVGVVRHLCDCDLQQPEKNENLHLNKDSGVRKEGDSREISDLRSSGRCARGLQKLFWTVSVWRFYYHQRQIHGPNFRVQGPSDSDPEFPPPSSQTLRFGAHPPSSDPTNPRTTPTKWTSPVQSCGVVYILFSSQDPTIHTPPP